ncbi:transcription antitermination factor NusB [Corynebacterium sp. P7003]|uniref:Transcription antitermination protein NusB n=1 Tax=Corynebacterium pygosceleis TaxID=2800406 RepID=A0ABT3WSL2_9CORY|nr:transcription antitermination factor NusB [Corynebacterium pygosceleis]MCX7443812.1 transcription antitermination factor NusB [Corynebacterium pygosceleis]
MTDNDRQSSGRRPAHKRRGSRFRARRRAVDILFEAEARDVDPVAIVDDRVELSRLPQPDVAPVAEYTRTIVEGTACELDRVDDTIARYLVEDWTFGRLPAVERAILRVAVWELLFNPEVPPVAAIDEAVRLTGDYSSETAQAYVNAVLDSVAGNLDALREGEPAPEAPDFLDPGDTEETGGDEDPDVPGETGDPGDPAHHVPSPPTDGAGEPESR